MLAITAGVSQSPSAAGTSQAMRENPLTSVTGLRCRFSLTTSVLWKEGKPDVRIERTDVAGHDFRHRYPGRHGRGRRAAGSPLCHDGPVGRQPLLHGEHAGALEVTTVFATESSPGKLKAVRAEYSYVFLTVPPFVPDPTVSQSYGECEPTRRG